MRPHHKQYIRLLDVIQADRGGAALRAQSSRHPADSNTKGSWQPERQLGEVCDERMQLEECCGGKREDKNKPRTNDERW